MQQDYYKKLVKKRRSRVVVERWLGRPGEIVRYLFVRPEENKKFLIVSSERNAGKAAIRCLDSVYNQKYDRKLVKHVFIDDASQDGTDDLIGKWLEDHPDHNVEYIGNKEREGGCANNLKGFRVAEPGMIVAELNGDDWLPDKKVLSFFNKVYEDKDVWMTYNTWKLSTFNIRYMGHHCKIPRGIVETNAFRECDIWFSSHLHTFRAELFYHVKEESMIDPQTGEYWKNADDQALYLSMLELAGRHSLHINRITYIYNLHVDSEIKLDPKGQRDRDLRIRKMPKYEPINNLYGNSEREK